MFAKTTIVSLLTFSLLALGSVGYAAFTSTVTVTGNATAGTLTINFVNSDGTTATSGAYTSSYTGTTDDPEVVCTSVVTTTSLTITVTKLDPGDTCTVTYYIKNFGTVKADSIAGSPGSGSIFGSSSDFTLTYTTPGGSLAPGAQASGTITITAGAGTLQSETGTSPTISITGTA